MGYKLNRLDKAKNKFLILLSITVALIANNINKDYPGGNTLTMLALGVFLSVGATFIGSIAADLAFKFKTVRKYILGPDFIEGYWFVKTYPLESKKSSPISKDGIAYMHYTPSGEFSVETTRILDGGQVVTTKSEVGHVRVTGGTMRYLNFFDLAAQEDGEKKGFSAGFFERDPSVSHCPQVFNSKIAIEGETQRLTRRGTKLSDEIVQVYIAKYRLQWKEYFLKNYDAQKEPKNPNENYPC